MVSTLKVAVIGVGGIAKLHMPGWTASEHTDVVAGADISEDALTRWSDEWHVARTTTDINSIITDPDIDIIDICTPNMVHADLTIAALDAGKHVVCEKPLAPTPAEIKRMIEARDRSGKLLQTAQHFRFMGKSKALKAEIDAGRLGDVYHARCWMLRRAGVPVRPTFLQKEHSGGGACIDIGVHILDLTLWLMGNPQPVTVTGVARADLSHKPGAFSQWGKALIPSTMDVEEFASAFVRFDNGASLILETSWMLHHNTPGDEQKVWLYGTDGGAQWPNCALYSTNNATQQFYDSTLIMTGDLLEPRAQGCFEFAQAVVDGATTSLVPSEQSLQVMQILDAVYESQNTGREVIIT